jgi:hypothetical protein
VWDLLVFAKDLLERREQGSSVRGLILLDDALATGGFEVTAETAGPLTAVPVRDMELPNARATSEQFLF